tara:strand:- start:83 stop:1060 length:978 start_codon:yes stop_codon:yes gene_type:complete
MNILYIIQSGKDIGMGHVSRGVSFIISAKYLGHECKLLNFSKANSYCEKTANYTSEFGILPVEINSLDNLIKYIKNNIFDYILIDFPNINYKDDNLLMYQISNYSKSVCIDDISNRRLYAKINFYPPIDWINTLDWSNFSGKLYIGWEFCILRPDIYQASLNKSNKKIFEYLITFGGSDPFSLTQKIANMIHINKPRSTISIICGKLTSSKDLPSSANISIYHNPINFIELINSSNRIITTFGVTMYELAYMKKQSYFICTQKDHILSSECFRELKNFHYLGFVNKLNESNIIKSLSEPLNTPSSKFNGKPNDKIIEILKKHIGQ